MLKPGILVTGAIRKTGCVVVVERLQAGHPVRAVLHRQDDHSVPLEPQDAEIAVADLSDVEDAAWQRHPLDH